MVAVSSLYSSVGESGQRRILISVNLRMWRLHVIASMLNPWALFTAVRAGQCRASAWFMLLMEQKFMQF